MAVPELVRDELFDLLWSINDGSYSPGDIARLEELADQHPEAARFYSQYAAICGLLSWERKKNSALRSACEPDLSAVRTSGENGDSIIGEYFVAADDGPLLSDPFQLSHQTPYPSTQFVGGPVFSYMVATVVLCAMLLGAWGYKISHSELDMVDTDTRQSLPDKTGFEREFVGRVTDMKDCRWAENAVPAMVGAYVPLKRKYELASGLMEITYSSGARVILEGPCSYTVDSDAGGYLRVGKLVARVEKKVASGQWPVARKEEGVESGEWRVERKVNGNGLAASAASEKLLATSHWPLATNPQSPAPSPQPLFSVRTPSAVVTDLGTEFGVEVGENGSTLSRVYQGSVEVRAITAEGKPHGDALVLRENETALVEKISSGKSEIVGNAPDAVDFVRDISELKYKTFDLADVVAGGDGFSGRRNSGIDPTNGQVRAIRLPTGVRPLPLEGDGRYHSVEGMPFIDGVFIPDGGGDAVQVSSAGHVFDWFSDTSNSTWQPIWAGGAFSPDHKNMSILDGVDYASPGHGLLFMHANNAITFDLEAIRRANPGSELTQLRAVVDMPGSGTVERQYYADILVLVDGVRRYQHRLEYNGRRAVSISVAIRDKERFLTLATTDAGDGIGHDWVIFGDPRLEMLVIGVSEEEAKENEK